MYFFKLFPGGKEEEEERRREEILKRVSILFIFLRITNTNMERFITGGRGGRDRGREEREREKYVYHGCNTYKTVYHSKISYKILQHASYFN